MTVDIRIGDVRDRLREMPDESVHCVVTSPPYWNLRDYGVAGQLGSEPTPDAHVAAMVEVFREVRRVLRPDGVCWVNYGDSYATGTMASRNPTSTSGPAVPASWAGRSQSKRGGTPAGLKTKDLCMVPFRFALAMQADGWWLRSVLPWVKRNAMPESTTDRPATAIEYVFMFTKSARYHYDADAVSMPTSPNTNLRISQNVAAQIGSFRANGGGQDQRADASGREGQYKKPRGWATAGRHDAASWSAMNQGKAPPPPSKTVTAVGMPASTRGTSK